MLGPENKYYHVDHITFYINDAQNLTIKGRCHSKRQVSDETMTNAINKFIIDLSQKYINEKNKLSSKHDVKIHDLITMLTNKYQVTPTNFMKLLEEYDLIESKYKTISKGILHDTQELTPKNISEGFVIYEKLSI